MKKILLIFCLCVSVAFGVGFVVIEPKIGIAPYQNFQSHAESESLDDFFDYGVDFYSSIPKLENFEFGLGAEIRRLHPSLSAKKNVGLFFTLFKLPTLLDTKLIARFGFLQNTTLQRTFYYAFGIEKTIYRVNFQVLFDDMSIKNHSTNAPYRSVVLKVGIKL